MLTVLSKRTLTRLTVFAGVLGLIASSMLFWQHTSSMFFWLLEGALVGVAIGFFFMTTMTMFAVKTDSPYETAQLSGMAQAGGYCLSAFGPSLYGMAFASNPAGNLQNVVYVAIVVMMLVACLRVVNIDKIDQ